MKRFQKYLDKTLNEQFIGDEQELHHLNINVRYCPESFDFLDEIEFVLTYQADMDIVISVAVEDMLIKRIMIGWVGPDGDEPADQKRQGIRPLRRDLA